MVYTTTSTRIRPKLSMHDIPNRYIIAEAETPNIGVGEHRPAVCNLQTAPIHVFDAFFMRLVNESEQRDSLLITLLQIIDRQVWSKTERWWAINALLDRKVAVPLYESREDALVALKEGKR